MGQVTGASEVRPQTLVNAFEGCYLKEIERNLAASDRDIHVMAGGSSATFCEADHETHVR